MSKYTIDDLSHQYDTLSKDVNRTTEELRALEKVVDTGQSENLKAHTEATEERTQLRYKVIQMFKELFGDKDSKRRGLAVSHRESDQKLDNILAMITHGKTAARITWAIGGGLILAFLGAVYSGTITLEFLQPK